MGLILTGISTNYRFHGSHMKGSKIKGRQRTTGCATPAYINKTSYLENQVLCLLNKRSQFAFKPLQINVCGGVDVEISGFLLWH
jgi:hypothetical protein